MRCSEPYLSEHGFAFLTDPIFSRSTVLCSPNAPGTWDLALSAQSPQRMKSLQVLVRKTLGDLLDSASASRRVQLNFKEDKTSLKVRAVPWVG